MAQDESMNAVLIRATGGRDVLRVQEVARPEPAPGEVLVKIRAAAVNPVDWKYRRGLVERDLPAVLGEDISGIVEASRAERFVPGDEVFGIASSGAMQSSPLPPGRHSRSSPTG